MSDAERDDGREEGGQSFISHLVELRERLLKAIAAVLLILTFGAGLQACHSL